MSSWKHGTAHDRRNIQEKDKGGGGEREIGVLIHIYIYIYNLSVKCVNKYHLGVFLTC